MSERVLMTAEDIRRALVRVAHEIVEAHKGTNDLVLLGMHTRGVPLARRLAAAIEQIEGVAVPVGTLDISQFRDDLSERSDLSDENLTAIPTDITGKCVVLVDDVLFTGRSIRAALDALMRCGRPRKVQAAVLVDRGHRELPIRPDFVGKNVPTRFGEHIAVKVSEVDGSDVVVLMGSINQVLSPQFAGPK